MYRICAPSQQATLLRGIRARLFPAELPQREFEGIITGAVSGDADDIEAAVDTPDRLGDMNFGQIFWDPGIYQGVVINAIKGAVVGPVADVEVLGNRFLVRRIVFTTVPTRCCTTSFR